jgi:hypothetical protein
MRAPRLNALKRVEWRAGLTVLQRAADAELFEVRSFHGPDHRSIRVPRRQVVLEPAP